MVSLSPAALLRGVGGLLTRRARRDPDVPALRTREREMTYGALDRAVNGAARGWSRRGVKAGQVVALRLGNRVETIVHELALARVGAAAALLDPKLSGPALQHALAVCGAVGLVGLEEDSVELGSRSYWSLPALTAEGLRISDAAVPNHWCRAETVFCYLFTSGTTGLPKAAPVRHRRFLSAGYAFQSLALRLGPGDTLFTPLPFHHASAQVIGLSSALWSGATFAFVSNFSARRYWDDARALKATAGLYIGEICRYLLATPPREDDRQHTVHTLVGNGLQADVWTRLQARFGVAKIVEFYGATEGNAVLINRNGKPGSCGRPLFVGPFDNLRLVRYDVDSGSHPRDPRGRLIPTAPGEPGELIARIGRVPGQRFDGYADAEATEAKILRDVLRPGDRWFRTGDLLRQDEDGDFFFVDRIGDTFRWKGENVSTDEVTAALRAVADVGDVAVYGVEIAGHEGRAGMAAVTGTPLDPVALYAAVAELPSHARPAFIRQRSALDRTATHKIERARLREEGFDETRCGGDALWVRDDAQGRYVPLTPAFRARIADGTLRL